MGERAFTSNLSVAEFAIGNQMRLKPLAQVMGSCVYQVGFQYGPSEGWFRPEAICQELGVITEAWNEARGSSLSRLAEEAGQLGADAVVGVTLRTSHLDWAAESLEFVVMGTAVSDPELASGGGPVLTDLSLQDYWKLREAGVTPCGLVAATSCFFIVRSMWAARMQNLNFAQNQEIPEFTQGIYVARETALKRLTGQIEQFGGEGVVGVGITHSITEQELQASRTFQGSRGGGPGVSGMVVTFHATGTAVRMDKPPVGIFPPETAIDLSS